MPAPPWPAAPAHEIRQYPASPPPQKKSSGNSPGCFPAPDALQHRFDATGPQRSHSSVYGRGFRCGHRRPHWPAGSGCWWTPHGRGERRCAWDWALENVGVIVHQWLCDRGCSRQGPGWWAVFSGTFRITRGRNFNTLISLDILVPGIGIAGMEFKGRFL